MTSVMKFVICLIFFIASGTKPSGKITWFKSSTGTWKFKLGSVSLTFVSLGNGYITIKGKKIKLIPGTSKYLPASKGFVSFKYGYYNFYLRFIKNVLYVYRFNGGCKKALYGAKGFCDSTKVTKVKGGKIFVTFTFI